MGINQEAGRKHDWLSGNESDSYLLLHLGQQVMGGNEISDFNFNNNFGPCFGVLRFQAF